MTLRGRHLLLLDAAATLLSFSGALALRFDAPSDVFGTYISVYRWVLPLLIVARLGAFVLLRLYQRVWRYASVDELLAVVWAVIGSSVVAYGVVVAVVIIVPEYKALGFPRTVAIIDTVLMIASAGAWRFAFRVVGIGRHGVASSTGERTLVVGEGAAALAILRELRAGPQLGLTAVGLIADDLGPGQRLMGVPVVGRLDQFTEVIKRLEVSAILLALPSASGPTLRRLVREADALGVRSLTVPGIAEIVAGRVTTTAIRDVDLEDLLRRAPAKIDLDAVAASLRGRCVLITGAGGSIGGELARQVLSFDPRCLILLGRGENSLFETLHSLRPTQAANLVPTVLDVTNAKRLDAVFERYRPEVVFHAAAHKHVTFMELFPEEAVLVNILGTLNVLTSAARHGVERFVSISTDKAVNPTSVMGVSKRVSELLVQDMAVRTGAKYATVRFGNVLSSRGSVVPLFRQQLARGGPLTVTDPDATRYFMTIPEAVQLVLQASVLAEPGDTFVLDMGEPVRIVQLARDLVELHGLKVGEDIELEFVGLRPGEKLVEELYFADEQPTSTTHEAVRRIIRSDATVTAGLRDAVAELAGLAALGDRDAIVAALQRLVPEYQPASAARPSSAVKR